MNRSTDFIKAPTYIRTDKCICIYINEDSLLV